MDSKALNLDLCKAIAAVITFAVTRVKGSAKAHPRSAFLGYVDVEVKLRATGTVLMVLPSLAVKLLSGVGKFVSFPEDERDGKHYPQYRTGSREFRALLTRAIFAHQDIATRCAAHEGALAARLAGTVPASTPAQASVPADIDPTLLARALAILQGQQQSNTPESDAPESAQTSAQGWDDIPF